MQELTINRNTYRDATFIPVKDVMNSPVVTAMRNANVRDIAQIMKVQDIDTVVIVGSSGEALGIVTEGDIVRRFLSTKKDLMSAKANDVMSTPAITIDEYAALEDAAKTMARKRINRLCVLNKEGRLAGIVTQTDIIKNASYLIDVFKEIIGSGYITEEEEKILDEIKE